MQLNILYPVDYHFCIPLAICSFLIIRYSHTRFSSMKLNNFFRYCLLLACGLFISCQNAERNDKRLDNTSHKVLGKIKYSKKLDDYLEKNKNKRYADVNDRNYKSLKNLRSDQDLSNQNFKSSVGPNNTHESDKVKILKKDDYYLPNKNKNENFTPKTVLESDLEDKEYNKISKHFNKNHPANKIKRELPECMGSTETKKRMSSADKFLSLDKKERERLLEKVLKEINRKLNRLEPGNGNDDDKSVEVKPQLLILNSKSKPKRDENSETDSSIGKAVENAYSSKTYQSTPSGFFNGATETVISPGLKINPGISSIGKQTGRNNVNIEQFTRNSKNFSKREDTQYQTDDEHLTSFMPGATQQKPLMKEPMETRRVQENKSEVNNKDEITTDQSGKTVKKKNKDGQPQLYQILKNPLETNKFGQNEGSSDSSKMSERTNNNYGEDGELMEYIKNNVKNCLQEMRKDVKEEKEKPEVKEEKEKPEAKEENHREETTSDIKENYPKETSPQLTEQPSLFDKLNNLNPNSPGYQLLWNILQSTPSKPNILLGEYQKTHAGNISPYKSPLIAQENYLDEVSSEENENDPYDVILQSELKNLYAPLAPTYTKPNMETTRFDRLWATDLLDELFFL